MVIRPLRWELEGFFEKICANDRVVFNVAGNKYRLVVEVQYRAGIVWVKFVDARHVFAKGSHQRWTPGLRPGYQRGGSNTGHSYFIGPYQ